MVLQNIGGILLVDTAIYGIFIPMSVCFNYMRYISTISRINQRLYQHFNDYLSFMIYRLRDMLYGFAV